MEKYSKEKNEKMAASSDAIAAIRIGEVPLRQPCSRKAAATFDRLFNLAGSPLLQPCYDDETSPLLQPCYDETSPLCR